MFTSKNLVLLLAVTASALHDNFECGAQDKTAGDDDAPPVLMILGIAQDAGYPQAACRKECCARAWDNPSLRRFATSVAVIDPATNQRWLFECTPNFPDQLRALDKAFPVPSSPGLDGILLTHAHIGHYAGLVHVGHEVMGAREVPVHVMPRMSEFLSSNGPWDQLVSFNNIRLMPLENGKVVQLNARLKVTPITVPHRDEYSETVAFVIQGPNKSVLFLPDIDKWTRWEKDITEQIKAVDVALLDATFFDGNELPGRDMSQILHPFIVESIARFEPLSAQQRAKVRFIHLNHTNPALDSASSASLSIRRAGMQVAEQLATIDL